MPAEWGVEAGAAGSESGLGEGEGLSAGSGGSGGGLDACELPPVLMHVGVRKL